jgi:hypothetical protein
LIGAFWWDLEDFYAEHNQRRNPGLHALIEKLGLKVPRPTVRSVLVGGIRKTRITDAQVLEQYPRAYDPADGIIGHLRFALKYEPLDLGGLQGSFQ